MIALLKNRHDLDSKDDYSRVPLSWAAMYRHEAMVKLLLEKGAKLESKDDYGQTPLSWAAEQGQEAVVKLLLEGCAIIGIDAIQPAKSSPVPASIELRPPEQVTSSPSPSAPSVRQATTTVSAEHPPLAPPIAPPAPTTSRAQTALSALVDPTAPSRPEQLSTCLLAYLSYPHSAPQMLHILPGMTYTSLPLTKQVG
jgi:hypothetical protein